MLERIAKYNEETKDHAKRRADLLDAYLDALISDLEIQLNESEGAK